MATLRTPSLIPSPAEDSDHLRKAFVGLGTNEALTIKILGHRNAEQRKSIRETYASTYGKDLLKDLEAELSGDFLRAMQIWTMDPFERDVVLVHEATKNGENWVIMEIASTRSSFHLFKVRQAYQIQYKRSFEEDVAQLTNGDFRKLLVPLVTAFRYEGDDVNLNLAKSEAKILHEKIFKKSFKDDEIIRVLSTRSKPQLNATLNQYNDLFGNPINKDLKDDPKNEYLKLLRATIKCLTFPEKYFEKVLRLAVKGIGTNEKALTRVVTTRAEFDLARIKEQFHKRNSITFDSAISGDTSGDYKKILLALSGHDDY